MLYVDHQISVEQLSNCAILSQKFWTKKTENDKIIKLIIIILDPHPFAYVNLIGRMNND